MRLRQICIHPWLAMTPGGSNHDSDQEEDEDADAPPGQCLCAAYASLTCSSPLLHLHALTC